VSATDAISDTARLEQRITELEVKVAFQERTIDDLDAVLRHFTARVEALERELSRVRGELEAPSPSTAEVLAALDDEPA
jgi:SlyX protein